MNGYIELTSEWVNLNGATITDINENTSTLTMLTDDEFYLQIDRSCDLYVSLSAYIWHGTKPTMANVKGAEILSTNEQGKLKKGVDDIWVRAATDNVNLVIRKIQ